MKRLIANFPDYRLASYRVLYAGKLSGSLDCSDKKGYRPVKVVIDDIA